MLIKLNILKYMNKLVILEISILGKMVKLLEGYASYKEYNDL